MGHFSATDFLSKLISIPSVNPAHSDEGSITGEKRMAEALLEIFQDFGLEADFLYPMGVERPAVIGKSRPAKVTTTLLFEMHLDTVGISGMSIDPFQAVVKDGKLYGRGACDMKGSMAALFDALTPERIQRLEQTGVQLILLGVPDEETGLGGSTKLAKTGLGADAAIVLEPTNCLPVIAHKGACWYDILLRGRSGHGSQPEKGISTNAALAELLPGLFDIHRELTRRYSHPLLGQSTLNIGKIVGGETYNIIPEQTKLQLDRRVIPNEPENLFPEIVQRKLDEMCASGRLLKGSCRLAAHTTPFSTSADGPLVRRLRKSIFKCTRKEESCLGTSWVSDASPFSRTCGEILVFGPGDIAQAHTENEYLSLKQLELGSAIFADFLDNYCVT